MGSEFAVPSLPPQFLHPLTILEIYGPQAYSPMWLLLGVVLAIVLIAWPVLAWWITRDKKARPLPPPPPPDPDQARHDAMAGIDSVAAEHAAGRLGHREATQALSRIVRQFVASTGFPGVDKMDLTQLTEQLAQRRQLAPVARYVEVLYPPSFGPDEVTATTVDQSIGQARELVGRWVVATPAPASTSPGSSVSPATQGSDGSEVRR